MFGPKVLTKLQQKKYRQEYGCFVVDGKKGVLEAVQTGSEVLQLIVSQSFVVEQPQFLRQAAFVPFVQQRNVVELSDSEFARIIDVSTPQGIAAVVKIPETQAANFFQKKTLVVLEDIRDPGNLGTMIRTADWFGVDGIILLGGTDPFQPKVVRSSMGSLFRVPLYRTTDFSIISQIRQAGFILAVTRPEGKDPLSSISSPKQVAIVFGNESEGTSEEIDSQADLAVSIGRHGQAESLNVAVSFGIVLAALRQEL